MKILLKLVFLSVSFCLPYWAALSMKNPFPMMLFAWVCLAGAIWLLSYRKRKKEQKWRRQWKYLQEMQYRKH